MRATPNSGYHLPAVIGGLLLCFSSPGYAVDPLVELGGGRPASTDCMATMKANVNWPPARPSSVRCVDGDSSCDADGIVIGVCTFSVAVCANSTFDAARCTSTGVSSITVAHALDNGSDPSFNPDFQALQALVDDDIFPPTAVADVCTSATNIQVRIKGPLGKPIGTKQRCRRSRKTLRLFTQPDPLGGRNDRDRLRLTCVPAATELGGCDPMILFTGTFDRIAKQVFSESCATGTCHDSESFAGAGGLLLEPNAAYNNLVGQPPQNDAALGHGWLRVTAGDPTTSFLYRKITNDLNAGGDLGKRMPRPPGRRMLPKTLREIIRLWIADGAPATGWVPNTE